MRRTRGLKSSKAFLFGNKTRCLDQLNPLSNFSPVRMSMSGYLWAYLMLMKFFSDFDIFMLSIFR